MISRYKAYLFDMDGTILDSMYHWRSVWREYIALHGLATPPELVGRETYYCSMAAGLIARDAGLNKSEVMGEIVDSLLFRHYMTDISPKPHVREALEAMNEAGVKMALFTATPLKYALPALERHDLLKYFCRTMDTRILGAGKHDGACFIRAAHMLQERPQDCAMFEDAVYAMRGAKKAGMGVIAIEEPMSAQDKNEIMSLADVYLPGWEALLTASAV